MPELPEVEVVKRGLESILGDQARIAKIVCTRKDLREELPVNDFKKMPGAKILSLSRRAKYILIKTDRGTLLSHLGMTGTWRLAPEGQEQKHDHVYIYLEDGRRLAYRDPRRFGYLGFIKSGESHAKLDHLGPEPLESEFNASYLLGALSNRSTAIKIAIMDQEVVVGVGNIYASEALFASGVNPLLPAKDLLKKDAQKLIKEIKKILTRSIEVGGSTISDFAKADGEKGYFQNTFFVYDREGKVCFSCNKSKIKKMVIGGRSSFWCPTCQK